jgi:hypothetical protein
MTADNRLPDDVIERAARAMFDRHCYIGSVEYIDPAHAEHCWSQLRAVYVKDATAALLAARDAEGGRDAADAARYRFLRSQRWNTAGIPFIARNEGHGFSMWTGEHADAAIDAALQADAARAGEDGNG